MEALHFAELFDRWMQNLYLTKYLTKAVAETCAGAEHPDPAYEAHIDRLHVRRTVIRVRGQGRIVKRPKSRAGERTFGFRSG